MMKAMRDQVKLIYWVVIVTFVGLTFLVWGVGLDNDSGPSQASRSVVATVNDIDISYDAWNQRVNSILNQMRTQLREGETLSENQMLRARDQAFDALVMETLQDEEASKMGLGVTDEEIVDILSNNPPADVLAYFVDENGNVDYDAYARALQNPENDWRQIENYLRQTVPIEKLQQLVSGKAVVGEVEIREAFAEQNQRAVAEYIGVEFSAMELPEGELGEGAVESYYNAHLDEYELAERRTVRLLVKTKEASEADEAEVLSILEEIREDILAGRQSFADAAQSWSEDTSAAEGGDLGFFDRDRMVAPFTEAAFALPVGEISAPVRTQFGYHLITVTDEKTTEDGARAEIQASHVLLKVQPSPDTVLAMRDAMDALRVQAEAQGLEIAAAAAELEVQLTAPFEANFNIPTVPNSLGGTRFAFDNGPGTLSPVFETQDSYYLFEVAEQLPAGHRPLEEVRSLVVSRVQRDQRADLAAGQLATAWSAVQAGKSFEEAAAETGLSFATTDTFTLRENIPGIGFATSFARAALALEPGQMLNDVRTQRGSYIVKLLWKSELDEGEFRAQRVNISRSLLFNRRRQMLVDWQKRLMDDAEIVDRRAEFL